MESLKIYYTLPYFLSKMENEVYARFLSYEQVSKARHIPFEMISFQSSPGRFLTDKAVFDIMDDSDDSIFPITVLNGEVVKTSALPTDFEFASWFETLGNISYEKLQDLAKHIKSDDFLPHDQPSLSCCSDSCIYCTGCACDMSDFLFDDLQEAE